MIRYICKGAVPHDRLLRFCHPSIDRLMDLVNVEECDKNCDISEQSREFSAILRHIRIAGVFKTTNSPRLIDSDRLLSTLLKDNCCDTTQLMDVGASDGITTLETVNFLESNLNVPVSAVLADRFIWLKRLKKACIVEYVTTDGLPVMVRCGPIGLLLEIPKIPPLAVTKWLWSRYLKCCRFRASMRPAGRILLVNPAVLVKGNIRFLEMDIFQMKK